MLKLESAFVNVKECLKNTLAMLDEEKYHERFQYCTLAINKSYNALTEIH